MHTRTPIYRSIYLLYICSIGKICGIYGADDKMNLRLRPFYHLNPLDLLDPLDHPRPLYLLRLFNPVNPIKSLNPLNSFNPY